MDGEWKRASRAIKGAVCGDGGEMDDVRAVTLGECVSICILGREEGDAGLVDVERVGSGARRKR